MAGRPRSGTRSPTRPAASRAATPATSPWTTTTASATTSRSWRPGVTAYRFSVAWPRITPQVTAEGWGRSTRRASPSTRTWSTRCWPRASTPRSRSTTGTCHKPSKTRAAGPTGRPPSGSASSPASWRRARLAGGPYITLNEPWCSAFLGYARACTRPAAPTRRRAHRRAPPQPGARPRRAAVRPPRRARRWRRAQPGGVRPPPTRPPTRRRPPGRRPAQPGVPRPDARGGYPADVLADTAHVTDWSFVRPGTWRRSRRRSTCSA